jgi:hypothetical protein
MSVLFFASLQCGMTFSHINAGRISGMLTGERKNCHIKPVPVNNRNPSGLNVLSTVKTVNIWV